MPLICISSEAAQNNLGLGYDLHSLLNLNSSHFICTVPQLIYLSWSVIHEVLERRRMDHHPILKIMCWCKQNHLNEKRNVCALI